MKFRRKIYSLLAWSVILVSLSLSNASLPIRVVNDVSDVPFTVIFEEEDRPSSTTTVSANFPTLASVTYLEDLYSANEGLPNECRRGEG